MYPRRLTARAGATMLETAFTVIAILNMIFATLAACYGPARLMIVAAACSVIAWLAWFLAGGWSAQRVLLALVAAAIWTPLLLAAGWLYRTYPGGGLLAYIQDVLNEKFRRKG
jgi:hypothetical protein